ncbi:MAG: pur operon repressor [Eubacteriaceae bacterium]|nr:pur operon repressor [Eubacteriaceae bacterium]
MKKNCRIGAMIKILSDSPSEFFGLDHFCRLFGAAKSSISEDLKAVRDVVSAMDMGTLETVPGTGGGVRFIPCVGDDACMRIQKDLCTMLSDPSRLLGGGFLYTSDIMFDPRSVGNMASIFARRFRDSGASCVVTIETKGIPLALMTARLLNIPLVVVRRETKISEGPTLSINYYSGSSNRIQKMSMSKKAAAPGSKALIIDDFMRAGSSLKGVLELLAEFDIDVCGIGVAIASVAPPVKKVDFYTPLVYLGDIDENVQTIQVFPNSQIF